MIVCNQCGNSMDESLRLCAECGAENPTSYRPDSQTTVRLNTDPHQATTADTYQQEVRQFQSQPSPAQDQHSPAIGPRFAPLSDGHVPTPVAAGGLPPHSNHNALLVVGAVLMGVLLIVLGGIGSRILLGNQSGEKNLPTAQSQEATNYQEATNHSPSPTGSMIVPNSNAARSQPERVTQVDGAALRQEVIDTLNGWAAATTAHDLDAHMSYYADTLDTYYHRQGVSASFVRADRARAFTRYSKLEIRISKIAVTVDTSSNTATAIFDKTFNGVGDKSYSGAVQQMVWLTKAGGRWRITGEKDLLVYYVNK